MFNTMKVARTIREARIAQNMTQMNLADAMEVSYQAVSNWERGNSMPDIAKLEQLCQILHISIEDLLGTDKTSNTLSKIIYQDTINPLETLEDSETDNANGTEEAFQETMTMEEIQDIAPLIPPSDMEKLVEKNVQSQKEKLNLSAITGLAPFLDKEYLDSLVKRAQVDNLKEIAGLAPFLSQNALDSLVMNVDPKDDLSGIIALAPFLSQETLRNLALQLSHIGSLKMLAGLAPFLDRETLDTLVLNSDLECDASGVISLAPFLSCAALDKLTDQILESGQSGKLLIGLCPFLSKESLHKIAESLMKQSDLTSLQNIVPFL